MTKEKLDEIRADAILADRLGSYTGTLTLYLLGEIDRLQAELDTVNNDIFMSEKNLQAAFKAAYKRGAEAMREAVARYLDDEAKYGYAEEVRSLPIPEYKNV